ncbi:MAG: Gfo/Idh/MocA family oxidoreductase [Gemmatimonadota bacterium]|nr:Gfo/Idh/MocA family oxidoreductase [Gemmatimonadota bacterium]
MAEDKNKGLGRRDFLKAAATVPVAGAFGYSVHKKGKYDKAAREEILGMGKEVSGTNPNILKRSYKRTASANDKIKIGFIGIGGRGKAHMRSCGFWPEDEQTPRGMEGTENLNLECTAICDLFQPGIDWALKATRGKAKVYQTYQELLDQADVDAVVIGTSDNWHAPITIAAAEAGKHIYVEKCMTCTIEEAFAVRDAVKKAGIIFQLGHQNRNSNRYDSAMEVVDKGMLGKINLIQCYTNRNTPTGAWVYNIPKEHGPMDAPTGAKNIDWKQYVANTPHPDMPYDPNRFFRWRCYWDYGTGLSGDLLTHELDVINMIMNLGIPATCVATGGVYYFKEYTTMMTADGEPLGANAPLPAGAVPRPDVPVIRREVPDMFQVSYEWPDRDLTVVYNATLANNHRRGQIYMGDDATMDLTHGVDVYADPQSERYKKLVESGKVKLDEPMISYRNVAGKGVEAITSATAQWTVAKGLLYTFRGGRMISTTYLHHKNWIDHIRDNNHDTMCDIDDGFQEAITAHMATMSLLKGCRVRWDAQKQEVTCDVQEGGYPPGVS